MGEASQSDSWALSSGTLLGPGSWWLALIPRFRRPVPEPNGTPTVLESSILIQVTAFTAMAGLLLLLIVSQFVMSWRWGVSVAGATCVSLAGFTHWLHYRLGGRVALRVLSAGLISCFVLLGTMSGGLQSPVVLNVFMVLVGISLALDRRWVQVMSLVLVLVFALWAYLYFEKRLGLRATPPQPLFLFIHVTLSLTFVNLPVQYAFARRRQVQTALESEARKVVELERHLAATLSTQKELFWHISHELRSPLTRLELAVRREFDAIAERPLAVPARIADELEGLRFRIDQMFVVAQLSSAEDHFDLTSVIDLDKLIDALCVEVGFEAADVDRHLTFVIRKSASVVGNLFLLRAAIENVVRNAVRFAPRHSEVKVVLDHLDAGTACVTVLDEGPGVPLPYLKEIFSPFFQVPHQTAELGGGSGLGLAIALQSVRRHGGTIRASNRRVRGLRVSIELPLSSVSANGGGLGTAI